MPRSSARDRLAAFDGAAYAKTSVALELLEAVGAGPDVEKVKKSKKLRAGKGKLRGRRNRQRRGPLVVYDPEVDGKELAKGFRNIPGVETGSVYALNLLQLAPGGHLGRFIIWDLGRLQGARRHLRLHHQAVGPQEGLPAAVQPGLPGRPDAPHQQLGNPERAQRAQGRSEDEAPGRAEEEPAAQTSRSCCA